MQRRLDGDDPSGLAVEASPGNQRLEKFASRGFVDRVAGLRGVSTDGCGDGQQSRGFIALAF